MKVRVTSQFAVAGSEDFDVETDQLMGALLIEEQQTDAVSEADVTASLERRQVTISLVVESESWEEAESIANTFVRAAIARVGGTVRGQIHRRPTEESMLVASAQGTELVPA